MKNLLFFIILCICYFSCKKEDLFNEFGRYKYGTGSLVLNGEKLSTNSVVAANNFYPVGLPDTAIVIEMSFYNDYGQLRGTFGMRNILPKEGKFNFSEDQLDSLGHPDTIQDTMLYNAGFVKWGGDGHLVAGSYCHPWSNSNSYVEIEEMNLATGNIKGNFRAKLLKNNDWSLSSLPDSLYITEGTFSTRIKLPLRME